MAGEVGQRKKNALNLEDFLTAAREALGSEIMIMILETVEDIKPRRSCNRMIKEIKGHQLRYHHSFSQSKSKKSTIFVTLHIDFKYISFIKGFTLAFSYFSLSAFENVKFFFLDYL